ncbi:unnamed protein product [Orchesella dallaii]|uniref:DUF4789 domain-containing protein n=1 Tax=Orchesella dallaii TaxID=48710 RepID=A0ABP1QAJ1_9HEXA
MITKHFFTLALTTSILIEVVFLLSAEAKFASQKIEERIVTDSETLLIGVPIDYSYNESHVRSDSSDGFSSVPGCPKSDGGYPWVHYGTPPKCYLAGQQGPCDGNQTLFVKTGSTFGFCSCNCFEGIQLINPFEDQFCNSKPVITLEFVHVADLDKCFAIYEQGPCGEDEWLVKAAENETYTTKKTYCDKRTCPIGKIPSISDDGEQECRDHFALYSFATGIQGNDNEEVCKSNGMEYSEIRKMCVPKVKKLLI